MPVLERPASRLLRRDRPIGAIEASALYVALSIVATWPLALGLGRDVAGDLEPSLLAMWALSWDIEQIRALLAGDLTRLGSFFDANIYHPAPLALARTDHLLPQALQVAPVYAITGDPILCYNLLFLSTYVLSAAGMFLLVRELTGSSRAAFVAGILYAFAPYRLSQSSHLHALSAQWMPFVLYGVVRYFESRRVRPLAGAAVALAVQGLSSGDYLAFFTPFAAAFALWELASRRLWRDRRVCLALAAAGLVAAALMAPLTGPHATLRAGHEGASAETEISRLSADVHAYAAPSATAGVWRSSGFPSPGGVAFPGLATLGLAAVGLLVGRRGNGGYLPRRDAPAAREAPRWVVWTLAAVAAGHAVAAAVTLAVRRVAIDLGIVEIRMTDVDQLLLRGAVALALLVAVSGAARLRAAAFLRTRGFFVLATAAAVWLSFGPMPQSQGRPVDVAAPYRWLMEHVPGFDFARAPGRFAMIAVCMLSVLAGFGAAALARVRLGAWLLPVAAAVAFVGGTRLPFEVNGAQTIRDYAPPEARVYRPARAPAVYRAAARLTGRALAELPLGHPVYDSRAVFYSTVHWRPIANGYGGVVPRHYAALSTALTDVPLHPELSLHALRALGVTNVIVHENAYRDGEGTATTAALRAAGAVEVWRDDHDVLLALDP